MSSAFISISQQKLTIFALSITKDNIYLVLKVTFDQSIANLIMLKKLVFIGLFKISISWDNVYDAIIKVYDVIN